MRLFSRKPFVPVLRFSGTIGSNPPLRGGLTLAGAAGAIEKAFSASKIPAVAVVINSPGGSPVQSHLIFQRIRQLAEEKGKRVHVFCEDLAASGGYFLALAGDEIYADPSSIVGSIGVISSGFGFDKAIEKLGIERRVHTSGLSKSTLDPFLPEKSEDVERLKALQRDVHEVFIGIVKARRGGKLKGADEELFSGAFWSGGKAVENGLIDGIGDMRSRMRALYGKDVQLKAFPLGKTSLLSRLTRGGPEIAGSGAVAALAATFTGGGNSAGGDDGGGLVSGMIAADTLSVLEARALWARFGL